MTDRIERAKVERDEDWSNAASIAPMLQFPRGWEVKIIPPFAGAMMRFVAYKGDAKVSVYADYHDVLGYFGAPHWEIYPDADGDNARFPLAETDQLISEISKSLARQNRTDKTPQQILLDAADLIEKTGWTQKAYARDSDGYALDESDASAVCFCAVGATKRSADGRSIPAIRAREMLINHLGGKTIPKWNDAPDQTAENVVATMRRAAA